MIEILRGLIKPIHDKLNEKGIEYEYSDSEQTLQVVWRAVYEKDWKYGIGRYDSALFKLWMRDGSKLVLFTFRPSGHPLEAKTYLLADPHCVDKIVMEVDNFVEFACQNWRLESSRDRLGTQLGLEA